MVVGCMLLGSPLKQTPMAAAGMATQVSPDQTCLQQFSSNIIFQ